jgi:cephalosporin hydroxylase/Flp pilus assembly protein TadD
MSVSTAPPSAQALEAPGRSVVSQPTERDVFIVGYPKSGNTWYQNLVAGVVFGCHPSLTPDHLVQELVPDVHSQSGFRRYGDRAFFKSHHLPRPEYRQVIYLLRDGRDAMVSYFHHLSALSATPVDFGRMVKEGKGLFPGRWHEHVDAWLQNPFKARLMVVRYEDLKSDCLKELHRLCEFLEMEREESWLKLLAGGAEFSRMQAKEATQGWANTAWPKEKQFLRRGVVGSYRDEMPPEILACFMEDAGATLARQGYLEGTRKPVLEPVPRGGKSWPGTSPAGADFAAGFASQSRASSTTLDSLAQVVEYLNHNAPRPALDILERRLASNPQQPQLLYGRALAQARLGCLAEAKESLHRLIALKPNHRKARLLLGELGPTAPSGKPAPDAPGVSATDVQVLVARAEKLLRAGQVVEALRTAEKAASLQVPLPGLQYVRCLCCNAVGRHEEALEAALAEAALNPGHREAREQVEHLTKALRRPQTFIPTAKRTWNSALPRETLHSIQNAGHNYSYRGIPIIKNPFDFALYPLLLWNLKPRTIIEIGSKAGGSAVWLADLLNNFGIDGHVRSIDIVRVTRHSHPRVTFLEGDGRDLGQTLTPEKLAVLPRPWLIIEDADHSYETSKHVLEFFDPHLDAGEYIVVEDGIISDLGNDPACNSGPHRALKEFLASREQEYEIDGAYCDFFGYNLTWNTNGYLKKLTPRAFAGHRENGTPEPRLERRTPMRREPVVLQRAASECGAPVQRKEGSRCSVTGLVEQAGQALEAGENENALQLLSRAKALRQPTRGLDLLRAKYHLRIKERATARQALLEELRYFPDNAEAKALLDTLPADQPVSVRVSEDESDFKEALRVIQPYTMLRVERLLSLYRLARKVCQENVPGNFVECGVAAGGSSALLAFVAKRHSRSPRFVYACDSFSGLPAPTADDHHQGASAEAAGWGAGTCAAPEASLREVCAKLGVADRVKPVKGFFNETLPRQRDWFGMIALLHMDGDWYESTRDILHNLYDHVANDGVVQVDDYGFWAGCKKALHEFEAQRGLRFALQTIDGTGVWFRKPDRFPVNPVLSAELIEQFLADDPTRKGVISQMSLNERYQLYHLVRTQLPRRSAPLRFIEIGSYSGASLLLTSLALGRTVKGAQGFAVEPSGQPQFQQVMQTLRKHVTHLKAFSHQAAPKLRQQFERDGNFPEFIFVDGDHSYAGVKRDILDYYPLLAPGGVMAFHDYLPALTPENREAVLFPHEGNEPGIRRACEELMEGTHRCEVLDVPLLYPTDPTQTQAHFPIIPGVFSTLRAYRKPAL